MTKIKSRPVYTQGNWSIEHTVFSGISGVSTEIVMAVAKIMVETERTKLALFLFITTKEPKVTKVFQSKRLPN